MYLDGLGDFLFGYGATEKKSRGNHPPGKTMLRGDPTNPFEQRRVENTLAT